MNNLIDELLHEGMYICWWLLYDNLLTNYYMNAYVELTWWLYDVAIKWWISMRL